MRLPDPSDKTQWVLTYHGTQEKRIFLTGRDAIQRFMDTIRGEEKFFWSLWGEEFSEPRLLVEFEPCWEEFCREETKSILMCDFADNSDEPTLVTEIPNSGNALQMNSYPLAEHSVYYRRAHKRVTAKIPVRILANGKELRSYSKSISAGGFCLDEKLSKQLKGQSVFLKVKPTDDADELGFHATIRDIESFGTLLIFDKHQLPSHVKQLKNWIDEIDQNKINRLLTSGLHER